MITPPPFIPGLALAERLYREAIAPILAQRWPALAYAAALLGPGSDVLGYDTPQSMDHDWGPRLLLFLRATDHAMLGEPISQALLAELPAEIAGYPTRYRRHPDGTRALAVDGPEHRVEIETVACYFARFLRFDPTGAFGAVEWVSVPQQHLLMLTAGCVFHDGNGALSQARARLAYYPREVWLYLLAAQWRRIAQEEAFMGRCGQVGDELGSRLVAARLACDLVRLCFLQERRYAPYIKWLGSAFALLDCAEELSPLLARALAADTWIERQAHLSAAYGAVARQHNALSITAPLTTEVSRFHGRPFDVLHAERFWAAIRAELRDPEVLALPPYLGGYDQWVDATDGTWHLPEIRSVYVSEE